MKITLRIILFLASILVLGSIFGVQDSFAENEEVKLSGEWYIGEGLKEGNRFSYNFCNANYKECVPMIFDILFIEKKIIDSEEVWLAQIFVREGNKITKAQITLDGMSLKPQSSSEVSKSHKYFYETIFWLSRHATNHTEISEDRYGVNGPKQFNQTKWGKISWIGGIYFGPTEMRQISVQGGEFDAILLSWTVSRVPSEVWVVDDFPLPIKAKVFSDVTMQPIIFYEYELLSYQENVELNSFSPTKLTKPNSLDGISNFDLIWYPPKKQLEDGILPQNVICKEHLRLMFKSSDGSPSCVTHHLFYKWEQRGWIYSLPNVE